MYKFINNYETELTAQAEIADTSITVNNPPPSLGSGQFYRLTIQNEDATLFEIVDVTAITGNVLTVTRGIESTTAQQWLVGSKVLCSITASQANNYDVKNEKWFTSASGAINRANGSKQKYTLTANESISFTLNDGDDLTLILNPATFTATFPAVTWFGLAPTLTAGKRHTIVISKDGSALYGWWQVAA